MAEITRNTQLAIVVESTEGTPVLPSATTDYVVLQDGFTMTNSFEEIANAELRGSIGDAPPFLGKESPDLSFSHYLTHSGVEGTSPEFDLVLKSLLGTQTTQSTERTTTSGSTAGTSAARAVVELAAGGSDYARGRAILLKDNATGRNYSIRNVYSVSSNSLTLAQNLDNAPATGKTCGKHIAFEPADSGHISYTAALYRANGGALEVASGLKTTECTIDITAGQPINASFSASGMKYYFDPIEITSSTKYIDFTTTAGTAAAQLTAKVYKDPYELAAEVQARMDAVAGASEVITCTYSSSTGKFTITASSTATFSILWNSGTNTANSAAAKLGFSTAANSTSALTYTSTTAQSWASGYTPDYDSQAAIIAKNAEVLFGDFSDITCYCVKSASIKISNELQDLDCLCAESGVTGTLPSKRMVSIDISAELTRHDADKFRRYRLGTETMVTINAGSKTNGNWDAGKCVNIWLARGRVSAHEVVDDNGIVFLNMTVTGYVEDSLGEFYINFL